MPIQDLESTSPRSSSFVGRVEPESSPKPNVRTNAFSNSTPTTTPLLSLKKNTQEKDTTYMANLFRRIWSVIHKIEITCVHFQPHRAS